MISLIEKIKLKMIEYDKGDTKRIAHLIKVHNYAALLGHMEGLSEHDQFVLEATALLHDIGVHLAEEKYGEAYGNFQEQLGPAEARRLLGGLSVMPEDIERICYIIGHHHTYYMIDGKDFQLLVEADFLVNLEEDKAERRAIEKAEKAVFKSKSGIELLHNIYAQNKYFDSQYNNNIKLAAEHRQTQDIMKMLVESYNAVIYVDLKHDLYKRYNQLTNDRSYADKAMPSAGSYSTGYIPKISRIIYPEDLDMVLFALDAANIHEALADKNKVSLTFRAIEGKELVYYEMLIIRPSDDSQFDSVVIAFVDVDAEVKSEVEYKERLEEEVINRLSELRDEKEKVEQISKELAQSLSDTIEAKDAYTNGHSKRVAIYSQMLAERLGLSENDQDEIYLTALLHDIGKIGIPISVINKPGRLTDEEYELIQQHPVIGCKILSSISSLPSASVGARWHHERYDGKGYPDQLAGTDIPLFARIIGVADSYDAMTSKRSYRDVMPQEKVRAEVERCLGSQFDPQIGALMLELIDEDVNYEMHEN